MHVMSSLEYAYLALELGRRLNGKHFGRIRKTGESTYRIKIASEEIACELGVRIHATRYIEPAESDKFTDKVEKELDNARLAEVRQVQGDRILSFVFDKGELVFEMFAQGNVILVRDGRTVCAHRYESWADREIKAGSPYRPPKTAPSGSLEPGDKYIIVSMMKLPLGKDYAAEILARAGIAEKTPGSALSGNRLLALEGEIARLRKEAAPLGFYEGEKMLDFSLAPLSRLAQAQKRPFATLSEAADEYYRGAEKPNPQLEKLAGRLEKQKERLAALKAEEESFKEKGDLIYARYNEVEMIIALAKSGKFGELERKGAKIDKKEKTVELDLQ